MVFPSTFADMMENELRLLSPPQRIISLVPSQTELLYDLGLGDKVVGITKFCVHPEEWFHSKTRIGGTKQIDFDKIAALNPDLIIGNKEENEEEQIRELQKHYTVWMSDIHNLREALAMIQSVGQLTNREEAGLYLSEIIKTQFENLKQNIASETEHTAAYLIWRNPYMAAGSNTFIDSMLRTLHIRNTISRERYPETTLNELADLSPGYILLSSEPYPFSEKHIGEIQAAVPSAKIILVDGEMFSWYGTRLLHAPRYFESLVKQLSR